MIKNLEEFQVDEETKIGAQPRRECEAEVSEGTVPQKPRCLGENDDEKNALDLEEENSENIQNFKITYLDGSTKIFNSRSIEELRVQVAESLDTCSKCIMLQNHSGGEVSDDRPIDHTDLFAVRLVQLEQEMKMWDAEEWKDKLVNAFTEVDVGFLDALALYAPEEIKNHVPDVMQETFDESGVRTIDILGEELIYFCRTALKKFDGWTPANSLLILVMVSQYGCFDVFNVLFAKVDGWTADQLQDAVRIASQNGYWKIMAVLLRKGEGWTADHLKEAVRHASCDGNREIVDTLLGKVEGWTADHLKEAVGSASFDGYQDIVDVLLEKVEGWTADHLQYAVCHASRDGFRDIVDILLEKVEGWTADHLQYAVGHASLDGFRDIVDILLEKVEGWTADHLQSAFRSASSHGYQDIVDILLGKVEGLTTQAS